jgi:hypothetical protein
MSNLPDPSEGWLSFVCYGCFARMRIRERYAHLPGHCPSCRTRITPIRPRPYEAQPFSTADEPTGVVDILDEWPEPAQLERLEHVGQYDMSSMRAPIEPPQEFDAIDSDAKDEGATYTMAPLTTEPPEPHWEVVADDEEELPHALDAEDPDSDTEIYLPAVPDVRPPPLPPPPVPDTSYRAILSEAPLPDADSIPTYQLSDPELNPVRSTPLPALPLWQGVVAFPFEPANLRHVLWMTMGFTLMVTLAGSINLMGGFLSKGDAVGDPTGLRLGAAGVAGMVLALIWISVWTCAHASSCFFATIEDTSSGNDSIEYPEATWKDKFWKFVYLVWLWTVVVLVVLTLLSGIALIVPFSAPAFRWWTLGLALLLYPISLLSTLSAGSVWVLVEPRLVKHLLQKWWILAVVLLYTVILSGLLLVLAYQVVIRGAFLYALIFGFGLALTVMLYGRVLGRAGRLLNEETPRKQTRKKRLRTTESHA